MNELNPIDLRDTQAKFRYLPRLTSRKIWIAALSALIVVAMGAWLTFLGWGVIEGLRAALKLVMAFF